jgi:hypothetical protein
MFVVREIHVRVDNSKEDKNLLLIGRGRGGKNRGVSKIPYQIKKKLLPGIGEQLSRKKRRLIGVASCIACAVTVFLTVFFTFFFIFKSAVGVGFDITILGGSSPPPFPFGILVNFTSWHRALIPLFT